jgi:hypothetical protein
MGKCRILWKNSTNLAYVMGELLKRVGQKTAVLL